MQAQHIHFYFVMTHLIHLQIVIQYPHQSLKWMLSCSEENAMEQSLFSRVSNSDVNLGGSSPQDNGGLGTILSPPPGPHTFQPGIGGYGSPTDAVAQPGTDNTDMSGKDGLCQVGR
jgi:hypothetical protein